MRSNIRGIISQAEHWPSSLLTAYLHVVMASESPCATLCLWFCPTAYSAPGTSSCNKIPYTEPRSMNPADVTRPDRIHYTVSSRIFGTLSSKRHRYILRLETFKQHKGIFVVNPIQSNLGYRKFMSN